MGLWARIFGQRGGEASEVEALRERLHRFRELVEKNNRVLELFADAGEKLGGDFLFDQQYLRTLTTELEETVRGVVDNLNLITGDRYPELVGVIEAIADDVQAAVESRVSVSRVELVLPLEQIDETLAEAVGEKMARLGELGKHLGCRVPDGFVISTTGCQRFLEEAFGVELGGGVFADDPDPQAFAEVSQQLRDRIRRSRLPKELRWAIRRALARWKKEGAQRRFAVRSSALGEDGELSFAGQYHTVLGVEPKQVASAYKEVLSSLYTPGVIEYRLSHGLHPVRGLMAVGCLLMVEARSSGVLYTLDPSHPEKDVAVVAASWGLGKTVVEGTAAVDSFEISRQPPNKVLTRSVATKQRMCAFVPGRGVESVPVPDDEQNNPAISDAELAELADIALRIERFMKCAQDIEWAIDHEGRLVILQARPLRIAQEAVSVDRDLSEVMGKHQILLANQGAVACRGIGCGRVQIVTGEEISKTPAGDVVLVAKTSSPRLASAMTRASAVITDLGTPTGHLAAIARELRVPTIVDTGNASRLLAQGQEITVDAEENIVYQGRVKELLDYQLLRASSYEEAAEFRLLRRVLKWIAPLNLRDPQSADFTAAGCTTYHDVIRFAHEKAAQELTEGHWLTPSARSRYVRRLELDVPLDLIIIDLGGGLEVDEEARAARREEIKSRPLCSLLEGLDTEGVWATEPADLDFGGLMSSMTRVSLTGPLAGRPHQNLAIVSREYLNLSLRLGYHFNIVDCCLAEERNENYIYFRFAGGVTELARRTRRSALIRSILEQHDFVVEGKGDLVIGRVKKLSTDATGERLRMIGRLIGFTRQLDVFLRDDSLVERFVNGFMEGRYRVVDDG